MVVPWREDDGGWFLSSSRGTKTVEVIPIAFQHLPPWIQGSLVGRYSLSMLRARKGAGQESMIISTISVDDEGNRIDRCHCSSILWLGTWGHVSHGFQSSSAGLLSPCSEQWAMWKHSLHRLSQLSMFSSCIAWGHTYTVVTVVVWVRLAHIGTCVWMLRYQGIELSERIRRCEGIDWKRHITRGGLWGFKAQTRPNLCLCLSLSHSLSPPCLCFFCLWIMM